MYLHSECTQFASSCLMQFTFSCDSLNLHDKYSYFPCYGKLGVTLSSVTRNIVWFKILFWTVSHCLKSYKVSVSFLHFTCDLSENVQKWCVQNGYLSLSVLHSRSYKLLLSVCLYVREEVIKNNFQTIMKTLRFSASGLYACWCLNWSNWIWGVFKYF